MKHLACALLLALGASLLPSPSHADGWVDPGTWKIDPASVQKDFIPLADFTYNGFTMVASAGLTTDPITGEMLLSSMTCQGTATKTYTWVTQNNAPPVTITLNESVSVSGGTIVPPGTAQSTAAISGFGGNSTTGKTAGHSLPYNKSLAWATIVTPTSNTVVRTLQLNCQATYEGGAVASGASALNVPQVPGPNPFGPGPNPIGPGPNPVGPGPNPGG